MLLCMLYLKLVLQILCEGSWLMGIWVVQDCNDVGDFPGIRGGSGGIRMSQVARLTQELRPKV